MSKLIIMPAYNAAKTLEKTIANLPDVYDRIILCDDKSQDNTITIAKKLGIQTIPHKKNRGYGANQKTLFQAAQKYKPDIIIMVHPDNQYDTSILPQAIEKISSGESDFILGTRMQTARKLGMPFWKILGNQFLSMWQRIIFKSSLSEFHSGLRIFRADILNQMPYENFSDNFVFDSQVLAWCFGHNKKISEIPTKCYYNSEASSVGMSQSLVYGLNTIKTLCQYVLSDYYKKN